MFFSGKSSYTAEPFLLFFPWMFDPFSWSFVLLELPWTLLWEIMFIRIVAATNWLDLKASKHLHDTHLMTFQHISQLLVKWLNFYGMLHIVLPWLANVHTVYDCAAPHLEIVLADFCWRKDFPSISEESNLIPWLNVGSVIAASHRSGAVTEDVTMGEILPQHSKRW